jgi:hypothetical protein
MQIKELSPPQTIIQAQCLIDLLKNRQEKHFFIQKYWRLTTLMHMDALNNLLTKKALNLFQIVKIKSMIESLRDLYMNMRND